MSQPSQPAADNSLFKVFLLKYYCIFVEILLYFMDFVMILSSWYCILSFTLLCRKFGIVKNYGFFGLNYFNLKSWLSKTNGILQVCFNHGRTKTANALCKKEAFIFQIGLPAKASL